MKTLLLRIADPAEGGGSATGDDVQTPEPEVTVPGPGEKVTKLVMLARDTVGSLLRRARSVGINDMNVLGPMETAFDAARNALERNVHTLKHAEDTLKPLKTAIHAIANHHLTAQNPAQLTAGKEELAKLTGEINRATK